MSNREHEDFLIERARQVRARMRERFKLTYPDELPPRADLSCCAKDSQSLCPARILEIGLIGRMRGTSIYSSRPDAERMSLEDHERIAWIYRSYYE